MKYKLAKIGMILFIVLFLVCVLGVLFSKAQSYTLKGKTLYMHGVTNLPYAVERKSFKGSFIPFGHDLAYKWRKIRLNDKVVRFKYIVSDEGRFWSKF